METTLKIEGMSCGHCVATVTDVLSEVEGVDEVNVSLEDNSAIVKGVVQKGELIKALSETPFKGL